MSYCKAIHVWCSIMGLAIVFLAGCSTPPQLSPTVIKPPVETISISSSQTPASLPPTSRWVLTQLQMIDAVQGWAVEAGGEILRTTDGGHTWVPVGPPEEGYKLGYALNAERAWASPAGRIMGDATGQARTYETAQTWRTTDGGKTWQPSQPFSLERVFAPDFKGFVTSYSANIQFMNADQGWLLIQADGESHMTYGWQLFLTTDGGLTWLRVNDSETYGGTLFSVAFTDENKGWGAGGFVGFVPAAEWDVWLHQTLDGGRTWLPIELPAPDELPTVFEGNERDCRAVAVTHLAAEAVGVQTDCIVFTPSESPHFSFFHLTPDGGLTWRAFLKAGEIEFIDAQIGWQLARSTEAGFELQHTRDGGLSWEILGSVPWHGDIDFVSAQQGWALARIGNEPAFLMTNDGGHTWQEADSDDAEKR